MRNSLFPISNTMFPVKVVMLVVLRKLFNTLNLREKRKKSSQICFQTHCSNHLLSQITKVSNIVIVCKFLIGFSEFWFTPSFYSCSNFSFILSFFFQFKLLTMAYFGKVLNATCKYFIFFCCSIIFCMIMSLQKQQRDKGTDK